MIHVGHFIDHHVYHLVDHHDGHLVHFHTETHTVSKRQIQTHTDRHTQTDPWTLDTETLECRYSRPFHKHIHTHKHTNTALIKNHSKDRRRHKYINLNPDTQSYSPKMC